MVKDVHIVDTAFAHAPGMSWYNVPRDIRWVRGETKRVPVRFFTDRNVGQVDNYSADVNVALLIEPRCLDENGYTICLKKRSQFNYVLTYDREFKQELGEQALFYPIGGCWLQPAQIGLQPKTKCMSLIASEKRQTHGHQLRHLIAERFGSRMDVYGRGYKPVVYKFEALASYRWSVVIENGQTNDLFTEKIIDCFLTGTIPIYWGTHAITDYFNRDGFFTFDTLSDFEHCLHLVDIMERNNGYGTPTLQAAIKDNFYRALEYRVAEDYIFSKYPFLLA